MELLTIAEIVGSKELSEGMAAASDAFALTLSDCDPPVTILPKESLAIYGIEPGKVWWGPHTIYSTFPLSDEDRARRKAKNKRRAATRFRARELRRFADASVSATDRPAGPAATQRGGVPVPEADITKACGCGMRAGECGCNRNIFVVPECARRGGAAPHREADLLAAIREIARK